ncbi:armadillo-type protein [Infundibulicybe gibba]|nr:armadillo-type protein [Infundibulicybe gibba]
MPESAEDTQASFNKLKAVCVPLLGASSLTPSSVPTVNQYLAALIDLLHEIQPPGHILPTSLVSYVFFPLSTILRRNAPSAIPDQTLERIFIVLSHLCDSWWWSCDLDIWKQIFVLCSAVIGGIEKNGKGRERDDETKHAAASCLLALLRKRREGEPNRTLNEGSNRLQEIQEYVRSNEFIPIIGQTIHSLLVTSESLSILLQNASLSVLLLLVDIYAPDFLIPSVLPGVVSSMSKVVLGVAGKKGWINGDAVAAGLAVMQAVVVRSVGDEICIREGAVRPIINLEDLDGQLEETSPLSSDGTQNRYATTRTPAWLRGTSTQLHIAFNALTPLVSHPKPSALRGLIIFSAEILGHTLITLPQTQPLLLSFLLALSNSDYPPVAAEARSSLIELFMVSSNAPKTILRTLLHLTVDNLAALPRLIPTHADTKVEHIAGMIEAVCRLAVSGENPPKPEISSIASEIGKLLGPTGGIEKWGWSLLSVLQFTNPPTAINQTPEAQLLLENDPDTIKSMSFPPLAFEHVVMRSTYDALERTFYALGRAGGEKSLFSIEWFLNAGLNGTSSRSVAALWCACRLLEGVQGRPITMWSSDVRMSNKRLEKLARSTAKDIAEQWDKVDMDLPTHPDAEEDTTTSDIQFVKGLVQVHENLNIIRSAPVSQSTTLRSQPLLHRGLSLQLLSVLADILQSRFIPLFIYTLYPVLHSLVSQSSYLSNTALATLYSVTTSTSYGSPANLLLSNFDYTLDAISRRLTRRWLDVDATKVLVIMVRLVGSDIVERAGDIVEECFDRLDDFHGYEIIVEGLIGVLVEVIKNIEADAHDDESMPLNQPKGADQLEEFFRWVPERHKPATEEENVDYGPAPRKAWGKDKTNTDTEGDSAEGNEPRDGESPGGDAPLTPAQHLTKQIASRSMYFVTHKSPTIRSRILNLLASSVPVLSESALLPIIHSAWPFILNRLADSESFVVSAAASLVEALAKYFGGFMFRRVWDDIWPRFRTMLGRLDASDMTSALARRGRGAVGTESAYTHSHKLYRSILNTMTAAARGVDSQDSAIWEVIIAFRRFLHSEAHEELQSCARNLYTAVGGKNSDAVWLGLSSTCNANYPEMGFLYDSRWDIKKNVDVIMNQID